MKVISTEKKVIKSWCNEPEEGALDQARDIANCPFIFRQVCLMPDTHKGYSLPIGGVVACDNVISPVFVGYDIGCGMTAINTKLKYQDVDIPKVMSKIRESIPLGSDHHKEVQEWDGFDEAPIHIDIIKEQLDRAKKQLGTLGGGNHFIELQKDEDDNLWFMIHSGSRNFGHQIATVYIKKAEKLCTQWYSDLPTTKGQDRVSFLPMDSIEGLEYRVAMNYALSFAYENRCRMMERCLEALETFVPASWEDMINIHHNYAIMENHFGKNVMVHRKGATSAKKGELGIIPGSQGTASYIVKGKGNPESFMSCSHGAGRKLGRKKAIEQLNMEEEVKSLNDKGILHSIRNATDMDEAPGAYKDIDIVMEEQKDLVEVVTKLIPLAVIKG